MMVVVDTNVLSEALRPAPSPVVVAWLTTHSAVYRVPTIVLAEMWAGLDILPGGARKARLSAAIQQIADRAAALDRLLPVTADVARAFGTVIAERQKKGKTTKPMDGLIAATALVHHAAIATRNNEDFSGLALKQINPWKDA